MVQALIAGGNVTFVEGFRENLRKAGVDVQWHVCIDSERNPYRGIPKGCDVVIIDIDGISHKDAEKVFEDAKSQGLPRARVHAKWSWAEPVLRMTGVLPPVAKNDSVILDPEFIRTEAIQYVVDSMAELRVPSVEEVEAFFQTSLGFPLKIPNSMRKEIYDMASTKVAENKAQMGGKISESDIREYTRLEVETDLELIRSPTVLANKIEASSSVVFDPHDHEIVQDEIKVVLHEWNQHHSCQTEATKAFKANALRNFLRRKIEISQKNNGKGWPSGETTVSLLSSWGITTSQVTLMNLRQDILGDWAYGLYPVPRVLAGITTWGASRDELTDLLQQGKIKGVIIERKGQPEWLTSETAVLDYLVTKNQVQVPDPKPVLVDPTPKKDLVPDPPKAADMTDLAIMVAEDVIKKVDASLNPIRGQITDLLGKMEAIPVPTSPNAIMEQMTNMMALVTNLSAQVANLTNQVANLNTNKRALALGIALETAGDYEITLSKNPSKSVGR